MIELELQARRGTFQLEIACTLKSPWTVVFGPSGAGKSILMRIIAGLEAPNRGRISVQGEYVLDTYTRLNKKPGQSPDRRRVGLVAQQPALFPHLSVFANIAYGLAGMNRAAAWQRASAMLELVGAEELADRSPRALSGGEAQRIALARAIAPMPRLLLLDEPLSALDASSRDQVLGRLQGWLAAEQIQTVLVTHDAADALATGAEVAVIQAGRLTGLGPAGVVLTSERERLLTRLGVPASVETSRQMTGFLTAPAPVVARKPEAETSAKSSPKPVSSPRKKRNS
jgi:ABC-type sulfate/molybdate transport systems ATPase subunit